MSPVVLLQKFWLSNWLAQNVTLDKIRQPHSRLILEIGLRRYREHLIQLLQRELLRLSNEAEDHAPSDEIESSIESKSASRGHDRGHAREGQAENTGKGVVDADGPGHALFTLNSREDLGGILESDRSFS